MKWVEQGEKPNKYFHNLEKTHYVKNLVIESLPLCDEDLE